MAGNVTTRAIRYFRDRENPQTGEVKLTPKTSANKPRNVLPVVTWEGFEDSYLKEIQVSINGSEYKQLGNAASGEAQLEASDFTESGEYELKIRAIDRAGNVSDEVKKIYYYKDTVSEVDKYAPTDVYAIERLGGSTILRFSNVSGVFPGDIEYEVHCGTTPLFVPGDDTLVKTGGRNGEIEVSGDMGQTYYYKLRAVTVDGEKKYSEFSDEISSTKLPESELNVRVGSKEIHEYLSVSTPNGTGSVELSEGNFIYEQSDIELPAPQIPIEISRVYNAKSQTLSEFGYGWSSTYDMYVSASKDKTKMYFQDGTKAVYVFTKNGEEYTCEDDSEMKLTVNDETIERTITDINEDNTEVKTEIEFESSYLITTKENEKFYFDDCGRLSLIEESNNTFVYIDYNKNGNITSVTTSRNQSAEYEYNEEGLVEKIIAAKGTELEYSYSYEYQDGYLIKATFNGAKNCDEKSQNGKIEYKYSYIDGLLTTITDAEANDYSVQYSDRNAYKFVYPNQEGYIFEYTASSTDNSYTTTVTKYRTTGRLYSEKYIFDNQGKITKKNDANGNTYSYYYDDKNNKALITSEKEVNSYYSLIDNKIQLVENNELSNNTEYDEKGNVIKEIASDGSITEYTYDYSEGKSENVKNLPITMRTTDVNKNIISSERYQYDDKGNEIKTIDCITNTVLISTYNEDGTVDKRTEVLADERSLDNISNDLTDDEVDDLVEQAENTGLESYSDSTEYNNNGDEISEESLEGTVSEYIKELYDETGNVTVHIQDSKEIQTDIIVEIEKSQNNVEAIEKIVSGTDVIVTLYEYDKFFRIVKTTEVSETKGKMNKKVTESSYNKNGSVISETDPQGRVTTYKYDSMNRVTETKLVAGNKEKITNTSYDFGSVSIHAGWGISTVNNTSVVINTNTQGEVIGKTYIDVYGRIVRELSNGLYVDYTYDKSGRVYTTYTGGIDESDTDINIEGKLSVTTYDAMGNQVATIINPEVKNHEFYVGEDSIVTQNIYDKTGKLAETIDAKGNSTSYEYDEQGRVTKVITAEGSSNIYSYDNLEKDSNGNITSVVEVTIDALGRVSKTTSNGAEQILSIVDESECNKDASSSVNYDGNLKTTYEYDESGNNIKEIYSDGSYVKNNYDNYGNKIYTYRFDKSGELDKTTEYIYDSEFNLIETIDSKKAGDYSDEATPYRYTFYEYDSLGRNISVAEINAVSNPSKGEIEEAKIKYIYDIDDNIKSIYYPNTSEDELKGITFEYNKDKWITEINGILSYNSDTFETTDTTVIREYEYYNDGKISSIRDYENFLNKGTNYIKRNYIYDVHDRVISMKYHNSIDENTILEQYDYSYDKISNITYRREIINYNNNYRDEERTYTYNNLNQLIKTSIKDNLTYKTTSIEYGYDAVGNKTSEKETVACTVVAEGLVQDSGDNDSTITETICKYNNLDQLISSTETKNGIAYTTTYEYDEKGNQIRVIDTKNNTEMEYTYNVENQLTDVKITTDGEMTSIQHNEYNGSGQRISKTDNGQTTNYYYQGSLLLYTTDAEGNKTSQNIIGNQGNVIASIRYGCKADGTVSENKDEQHVYFYSKDIQGSTSVITDEKGNCVQSYDYTDFGETTETISTEFYNEICYTGSVYDEVTGLYYLNARYYNPEEGVFLSQDTYRGSNMDVGSWNLYTYCSGDPINYADPSGHCKHQTGSAKFMYNCIYCNKKSMNDFCAREKRKYIYNYLKKNMKLKKKQACAVLGNIYTETWHTFDSRILQGSSSINKEYIENYDAYDGIGWGILQWTHCSRKKALYDYAKKQNKKSKNVSYDVGDLYIQLKFFNKERKKGEYKVSWEKFKKQKGLKNMVESFCKEYEKAGTPHMDERKKAAKKYYKEYK